MDASEKSISCADCEEETNPATVEAGLDFDRKTGGMVLNVPVADNPLRKVLRFVAIWPL